MTETETPTVTAPIHAQSPELSEGRSAVADRSESDLLDGNEPIPGVGPDTELSAGVIRHGCGQWWTGTRVAHCGGCHRSFSSTTAFDQHQRGGEPGKLCRDPAEVGLVPVEKPYGVLWSWPDSGRNPHAKDGDQ